MLEILAAAASSPPGGTIHWNDLGLISGIDLGFFTLRFYSLAYILGLVLAYVHLRKMLAAPGAPMARRHADDLFFYCMMGVILGGRLGYVLFYRPELLGTVDMFKTWEGGMSFHGGLIGVVLAIAFVSWRGGLSFMRVCDYIAVNVGAAMLLGRLANFINGELWGRPAGPEVPWAMTFCDLGHDGAQCLSSFTPRHPSQLYEAALEGLLVAVVLYSLFWLTRARYRPGLLVGVFTAMIAAGRFIVEYYREPDSHLAWVVEETGLSRGQWLTIPLILLGIGLVVWSLMRKPVDSGYVPPKGQPANG